MSAPPFPPSSSPILSAIEHTLLRSSATPKEVEVLCAEAIAHGFFGVCVNPRFVSLAASVLAHSPSRVVTVVGFPLGATLDAAVARETELAVAAGAHEIDMVIPLGAALSGDFAAVETTVAAVVRAAAPHPVKAILETGWFEGEALRAPALAALNGGAHFLKTSTGFGPRGATTEEVVVLSQLAAGRAQVKAAGGIRTHSDALAMLKAGASRLGTSSGVAIAQEIETRTERPASPSPQTNY